MNDNIRLMFMNLHLLSTKRLKNVRVEIVRLDKHLSTTAVNIHPCTYAGKGFQRTRSEYQGESYDCAGLVANFY